MAEAAPINQFPVDDGATSPAFRAASRYVPTMAVDWDFDDVDGVLTISSDELFLRIEVSTEDLGSFVGVDGASWPERRSLPIGTTLGTRCWWTVDPAAPGIVTLLVGADDESWDLAVTLPVATVLKIATAI